MTLFSTIVDEVFLYVRERLEELREENLVRELPPPFSEYNVSRGTFRDGGREREVIIFCSNDYLGMTKDKEVLEEMVRAILRMGGGAGASRLVSGNFRYHEEFEDFIRGFFGLKEKQKDVLIFNSGWSANVGVISALCDDNSEIFSDELNHASIIDGIRLSKAKKSIFRHTDLDHLESLLRGSSAKFKLVISDAVFSMDGDLAPLDKIKFLCEKYGAALYVDEAHAFGLFGRGGRGLSDWMGIEPDILLFTLSKSVGLFGACVIAPQYVIRFLRSRARSFIFATALPPFILAGAKKSIQIIERAEDKRRKVFDNSRFLKLKLAEAFGEDEYIRRSIYSQITPFVIGDEVSALEISRLLLERGFFVQAIRYPSVPRGTSRLRITVSSEHSQEEIEILVENLKEVSKNVPRGTLFENRN